MHAGMNVRLLSCCAVASILIACADDEGKKKPRGTESGGAAGMNGSGTDSGGADSGNAGESNSPATGGAEGSGAATSDGGETASGGVGNGIGGSGDGAGGGGTASPDAAEALCQKYGVDDLLAVGGTQHEQINTEPPAPTPMGGEIVDGIYDGISNTNFYVGGTGTSGGADMNMIVFENGAWFYRYWFDGIDDLNYSAGVYTLDENAGTIMFGESLCGFGGVPASDDDVLDYTATATTFATYRYNTDPDRTKEILFELR
jgi:hypothetical protein